MSADDEPLPVRQQRWNSFVFLVDVSLIYLLAPVVYVGVLHATILKSLDASDAVANLPSSVYSWVMPVPVLIAWFWPAPGLMRPMLATTYFLMGAGGLAAAAICLVAPAEWLIPVLIAHAGLIGIGNGVRQMCVWELLRRGLSAERRGWTLGVTFGLGPAFAVAGACAAQVILSGEFLGVIHTTPVPAPWCYAWLFGATCPALWLSASALCLVSLPPVAGAPTRFSLANLRAGLTLYFGNPCVLLAAAGLLLTYGGTTIMNNLSLYAQQVTGHPSSDYAGLQLALRFGCKGAAGFALGWLLVRVNARASLLATSATCLAGVWWALLLPGDWYLLSFGFLGAGELFYVYYMNYIVGCTPPERARECTAYTTVLTVAVGFFPVLYGLVSDRFGLRASFGVAIAAFGLAVLLVLIGLPAEPRRPPSEVAPRRA